MKSEINNCGLVALRNISDLKNVSVRTLINLAEDNGLKLYPYTLTKEDIESVELPAIFHSDNHFVYIVNKKELGNYNLTGEVLFTKEQPYRVIQYSETMSITGQWVTAAIAGTAATAAAVKIGIAAHKKKKAQKWLKDHPEVVEPLNKEVVQNQQLAQIRANTGLPSEQYNIAMKNIQNQQLLALKRASLLGGGKALGIVGAVNEQGNNAVGQLDANNAGARLRNEGQLINVNARLAWEKARLFNANVREPDLRIRYAKYKDITDSDQNIASGIDQMAAAGGQYASSMGGGSGGGGNTGGWGGRSQNGGGGNRNSSYMRMYWGG